MVSVLAEACEPSMSVLYGSLDIRLYRSSHLLVFIHYPGRPKQTLHVDTVHDGDLSIRKLFQWFADIRQCQESLPGSLQLDIVADFGHCEFLCHVGVAFLGGLTRWVESRGGRISLDCETMSVPIHRNLQQNGFLHEFGCSVTGWEGNSVPYRHDLHNADQSIGRYLSTAWLGRDWVTVSPAAKSVIVSQAAELYTNAFEHSRSPIGVFSCGQRYPKIETLHLAVVDFGVGIASNVCTMPENKGMSASEAILWAFEEGNSTRQNSVPGGMGLNSLQRFIHSRHGELRVFSSDGCARISHNGSMCQDKCTSFPGTLVNIAFKCDGSNDQVGSVSDSASDSWF